ncbi:MAG: hypothetical protein JWR85_4069 [Marmoricola sp.]|nr:hypothetical protein [Marmoricola sp.]
MNRKTVIAGVAIALGLGTAGCTSEADRANENLSKAAENFEVPRRIVGINAITDTVLFSVEGFCSYETGGGNIEAICKNPDGSISRTTMGKSDNVTFVSTQMEGSKVDLFRPRVIFRPETIIPDFDLSTSNGG